MSERPILFSGPMVKAIQNGSKTVTRRVVQWRSDKADAEDGNICIPLNDGTWWPYYSIDGNETPLRCPYGDAGTRLWLRETWRTEERESDMVDGIRFRADNAFVSIAPTVEAAELWMGVYANGRHGAKWRPSIFMPRWASRTTLEVESVRAERLHEITEADVLAEGFKKLSKDGGRTWKYGLADSDGLPGTDDHGWPWGEWETDARAAFFKGWDRLNRARGFGADVDPWVFVVSFRRVTPAEEGA